MKSLEDISCTAKTYQVCPACKTITRLDTEEGLGRIKVNLGVPYVRCGCGEIFKMEIKVN